MSNSRYLELSSRYRNRAEWPLPGQFEVPISQSGTKGKLDALDPVSLAAPIHSWCSNEFQFGVAGSATTALGVSIEPVLTTSTTETFIITAIGLGAGILQPIENYYSNALLTRGGSNVRIVSYHFLGTDAAGDDHALVTVAPPLAAADLVAGAAVTITDPTSIISPDPSPNIFVPAGRLGSNAYPGCLLYNETRMEYRPIINYDFTTHMLELDTSVAAGGPVVGWMNSHCFSIRCDQIPCLVGVVPLSIPPSTASSIVLPATASTVDDFYVGDFVYFPVTAPPAVAPQGEFRRIVDYIGATRTAIVDPPFSAVPAVGMAVQVLCFSYDNAVPFNYTGSLVSQSQMVCYEIELINLILPNQTLNVGRGSRTAFYQYVYVELQNVSAANAGHPGVIYSNNPNAVRMLFRATIDDTQNPIISTFNKIDGDGMTQTVKFKPNDNLRFSVRMSNGEVFQTLVQDTVSPVPPNDLIQVTALFSLKRL